MNVFTVLDVKADAFMTPFFSATEATAIRSFQAASNEEGHAFHRNAEDFTLWRIGTWDENEGLFVPIVKIQIAQAITLQDMPMHQVPAQIKEAG